MNLTNDQVKRLCKLFNLSITKRKFILIHGELASISLIRNTWKLPVTFILPRGLWLNMERCPDTTEYSHGYSSEQTLKENLRMLDELLKENDCVKPTPVITISEGYQITYKGGNIGSKFDFGNGGKRGISFPEKFYDYPAVFYSQQEVIDGLKSLVCYIVDQLLKKKQWSSIKDPKGIILNDVRNILTNK